MFYLYLSLGMLQTAAGIYLIATARRQPLGNVDPYYWKMDALLGGFAGLFGGIGLITLALL